MEKSKKKIIIATICWIFANVTMTYLCINTIMEIFTSQIMRIINPILAVLVVASVAYSDKIFKNYISEKVVSIVLRYSLVIVVMTFLIFYLILQVI